MSKVLDFSIILEHPNNKEIIEKLMNGIPPKEVSQWLKLKYPDKEQSHLRISIKLLTDFIKSDYTDCWNNFNQDVADVAFVKKTNGKLNKKKISAALANDKTYRERVLAYVDKELDLKNMLQTLIMVCHDRAEQVFDQIQNNPQSFKGDRTLLNYMTEIFNMADKFERIINNAPDQIIQHNFTLQAVETNTNAMLEAIRKTLAKMSPEMALIFMDSFYQELKNLEAPDLEEMTQEDRIKEATLLQEKLVINNDSNKD